MWAELSDQPHGSVPSKNESEMQKDKENINLKPELPNAVLNASVSWVGVLIKCSEFHSR